MEWKTVSFDWNQARAFLATAEEGSLSAAARALGQTQPTLSRQVAALEETLGAVLFEREGKALVLTPAGADLLVHVRDMAEAAGRLSLVASARSTSVEGLVSVSSSDVLAAWLLPPVIEDLRAAYPGIEIEVVATNTLSNLQRREADIAVRHVRPVEDELFARRLPDFTANFYATPAFIARHGPFAGPGDLAGVPFIAFGDPAGFIEALATSGIVLTPDQFPVRAESGIVAWECVRRGLGVGVMADRVAELSSDVTLVFPDVPPLTFPTWLVAHRELHTSRRVRRVFDFLADRLGTP